MVLHRLACSLTGEAELAERFQAFDVRFDGEAFHRSKGVGEESQLALGRLLWVELAKTSRP